MANDASTTAQVSTDNRFFAPHRSRVEIKLASHGEIEKSLKPRQREQKWLDGDIEEGISRSGKRKSKKEKEREIRRRQGNGRVKTQRTAKTRLKMKGRLTTYFR